MPTFRTDEIIEQFQNRNNVIKPPEPGAKQATPPASSPGPAPGSAPAGNNAPEKPSTISQTDWDKYKLDLNKGGFNGIVTQLIEQGAPADVVAKYVRAYSGNISLPPQVRVALNTALSGEPSSYETAGGKKVEIKPAEVRKQETGGETGLISLSSSWEPGNSANKQSLIEALKNDGYDKFTDYEVNSIIELLDAGAISKEGIDVAKAQKAGVKDISALYRMSQGYQRGGEDLQEVLSYYPKDVVKDYKDRYGDYWERAITTYAVKGRRNVITADQFQKTQNLFAVFGGEMPFGASYNPGTGKVTLVDGSQLEADEFIKYAEDKPKQEFLKAIADQPQELIDAFKEGGYAAYQKAATKYNEKVQENKAASGVAPMLTNEKAVGYQVETSPRILRTAYEKGGAEGYNKAVKDAYELLATYKNKDGSYNILDAMLAARKAKTNREDMAIVDALATVFPADKVEQIRKDNLARLTMGQEKGSIWGDSWTAAQASLPGWLVGLAGAAKGTPIPQDDLIMGGALAVIAGVIFVPKIISNIRKSGGSVGDGAIVVLNKNDARLLDPKTLYPTGGYISNIPPVSLPKGIPALVPPYIKPTTGELLIPPSFKQEMEQIIGVRSQVLFLPTPGVRFKAEDYIMDYAGLKLAEKNLRESIPQTAETSDWDKLLNEANDEKEKQKVFDDIDKFLKSAAGAAKETQTLSDKMRVLETYETAHQEYLRKLNIWLNAWDSHVASLNPTPVRGKLNDKALQAVAIIQLLKYINPDRPLYIHNLNLQTPERVLAGSPGIKKALEIFEQTYHKAMTSGSTSEQAEIKAQTELQKFLQRVTQTQRAVKAANDTARQTQTKTQARTLEQTARQRAIPKVATATTATMEDTSISARSSARTNIRVLKLIKNKEGILLKGGGGSDKEKRAIIASSGGAVAWRMGKVGGKDRWDTVINPYQSNEQYLMVLGKAPEGATIIKRGKGSSYATAQMLRGQPPPKPFMVDSGFEDIHISSKNRQINMRVTPDTKGLTKGDITIGNPSLHISKKLQPLTRRSLRISGKGSRITPKMPKLR